MAPVQSPEPRICNASFQVCCAVCNREAVPDSGKDLTLGLRAVSLVSYGQQVPHAHRYLGFLSCPCDKMLLTEATSGLILVRFRDTAHHSEGSQAAGSRSSWSHHHCDRNLDKCLCCSSSGFVRGLIQLACSASLCCLFLF